MADHELDFTFLWSVYLNGPPLSRWMTSKNLRRKTRSFAADSLEKRGATMRMNRRSQEYIHFPWIEGTEIATDSVGCPRCAQDSKITIMHLRFGSQNAASCMQQRIACSFQDTRLNIPHMRSCTCLRACRYLTRVSRMSHSPHSPSQLDRISLAKGRQEWNGDAAKTRCLTVTTLCHSVRGRNKSSTSHSL